MLESEHKYMSPRYLIGSVVFLCAGIFAVMYALYGHVPVPTLQAGVNILASLSDATTTNSILQSGPSVIAVGDIMLGRQVENDMDRYGDSYPFAHIDDFMKNSDGVIANLEGPVVENHVVTPSMSLHFEFDTRMPAVIKSHNITVVNLANNHTYDDDGAYGFDQTVKYLDQAGVMHAGNPFKIGDEYVLHTTIKNKKFIFVGFNITHPDFDFVAAHAFVQKIFKEKQSDEFMIAMVHGGEEYSLHSNATQENFDRGLVDGGVDLVLAHHPHVVEEVEKYKNKLIFYSLGNFIFDQYFSQDVQDELAVNITFNKDSTHYELVPILSTNSQPAVMDDAHKKAFLLSLAERCDPSIQEEIRRGSIDIN